MSRHSLIPSSAAYDGGEKKVSSTSHSLMDKNNSPPHSSVESGDETDGSGKLQKGTQQPKLFEPYWRDSGFIKRKLGSVDEEPLYPSVEGGEPNMAASRLSFKCGLNKEQASSGSEHSVASSSVPSEPLPNSSEVAEKTPAKLDGSEGGKKMNFLTHNEGQTQQQKLNNERGGAPTTSPVETIRGLSPEHDPRRKIKFSTSPIPVYKTWGTEWDLRLGF